MKTAQDVFYKDLEVNLAAHRVSRAGHELCLTPREFALLAVLLTHCDKALSRRPAVGGRLGVRLHRREPHRGCTYQPPAPQAGTGK